MTDIISQLKGMDDATLSKKIGFADKLANFRADLERADKLSGDSRTKVAEAINKAFTPSSYIIEDLGWQVDRAEKSTKKDSCAATDFVNECGCTDHID